MPVVRVDALITCDGCSKRFGVELDLAEELSPSPFTDFQALTEETIRNGAEGYVWGVRGRSTVDRLPLPYSVTLQGGLLLCDACSRKCDEATGEDGKEIDDNLTRVEVLRVLRLPLSNDEMREQRRDEGATTHDDDENE